MKTAVHDAPARKFRANLRLQAYRRHKTASLKCKGFPLKLKWSHTVSTRSRPTSVRMRRWANSTRFFRSTRCRPGCEPNDPQVVEYTQWGRERAVATPFGVQGHSNLTNHHCGRCLRLSRNMITFDAALSTSKLKAVEYDLGPTCCAIETRACAQTRTNIPLGVLALPESHHK